MNRSALFLLLPILSGCNVHSQDPSKTDGNVTAVAGTAIQYSIVVTNNGPSTISGAPVDDVMPVQLSSVSWTCAASSPDGWSARPWPPCTTASSSARPASRSGTDLTTTTALGSGGQSMSA